jgi:hypothetical protein
MGRSIELLLMKLDVHYCSGSWKERIYQGMLQVTNLGILQLTSKVYFKKGTNYQVMILEFNQFFYYCVTMNLVEPCIAFHCRCLIM